MTDDFMALVGTAITILDDATLDGDNAGKKGLWRSESIADQIQHIEAHITQHQCGNRDEYHLAHIVCRAVIACALREMEKGKIDPVSKQMPIQSVTLQERS